MRHNPANPDWPDRDRFVLSAGHACILQYAALHLAGYDLSLEELKRFRQWESRTPGHPEHFHTGASRRRRARSGQGFANGVGMAIAERFLAERYNRPHHEIVDHRIYAICSDGDLMEGVSHEAASIAGHLGLGKLVYVYDDNHITIDGTTVAHVHAEDQGTRFEAYGWHVQHVDDAEDLDALRAALARAAAEERAAVADRRCARTSPIRAPHAIDTAKAHGAPLGEDEVRADEGGARLGSRRARSSSPTRCASTWPRVPSAAIEPRAGVAATRFERWAAAFPALREELGRGAPASRAPGWLEALPEFEAGRGRWPRATPARR